MLLGGSRPLRVGRGSSAHGEEGADGGGCSRGGSRLDWLTTDDGVQDGQEATVEDMAAKCACVRDADSAASFWQICKPQAEREQETERKQECSRRDLQWVSQTNPETRCACELHTGTLHRRWQHRPTEEPHSLLKQEGSEDAHGSLQGFITIPCSKPYRQNIHGMKCTPHICYHICYHLHSLPERQHTRNCGRNTDSACRCSMAYPSREKKVFSQSGGICVMISLWIETNQSRYPSFPNTS
jgi:hypothetical protein